MRAAANCMNAGDEGAKYPTEISNKILCIDTYHKCQRTALPLLRVAVDSVYSCVRIGGDTPRFPPIKYQTYQTSCTLM